MLYYQLIEKENRIRNQQKMNSFLSKLKNGMAFSKNQTFLLLNIYEIEILLLIFIGTNFQFYTKFMLAFNKNKQNLPFLNICLLFFHLFGLIVLLLQIVLPKIFLYNKKILKFSLVFLRCYKNVLMIPAFTISFRMITNSKTFVDTLASFINVIIGIIFIYLNEISNISYRFIVKDYCHKLYSTLVCQTMSLIVIFTHCNLNSQYACIVLISKNVVRIIRIFLNYQNIQIQINLAAHSLYQITICLAILFTIFFEIDVAENVSVSVFVLMFSYIVVRNLAGKLIDFKIRNILKNTLKTSSEYSGMDRENMQLTVNQCECQIRALIMIYLQKIKHQKDEPNQYSKYWKYFTQKITQHRTYCQNLKCRCVFIKNSKTNQNKVFVKQLILLLNKSFIKFNKQFRFKLMNIYMYIEIAERPLKSYYQLMRLKQQKQSFDFISQVDNLKIQIQDYFDQIFLKNKVKNQKLDLIKVLEFEELTSDCQNNFKKIITETIQFYQIFSSNTLKIQKINQYSNSLMNLKKSFENSLQKIITNYSLNSKLNILIYFYYNYLQFYNNKEDQLKKLNNQQLIKKRFTQKNSINVFNYQYGTIYIDLVQEKGKIINLTKNICHLFNQTKQDMVNFNINLFMPRLYGKHHAKFLQNFIQHGKIKLLKESYRKEFGKNKKKFIFPLNITLKAQYLQGNSFGSSGLIKSTQTNPQFLIIDKNGKIQQLTEGLYKRVFKIAFKQESLKVNRLHIHKILPSFNFLSETLQSQPNKYNKIVEGAMIFSVDDSYLFQKFKFIKQLHKMGATMTQKSEATSMTSSLFQQTAQTNVSDSVILSYYKQIFKSFLKQIQPFKLSAVKVSYKVIKLVTAQFTADLIEIISISNYHSQKQMYRSILKQLYPLVQHYHLKQDDHQSILQRLKDYQTKLDSQEYQSDIHRTHTSTQQQIVFNLMNGNHLMAQKAHRNNQNIVANTELQSLDFQQKNKIESQRLNHIQKVSGGSSAIDYLDQQSKKQILINAFNGDQKIKGKKLKYTVLGIIIVLVIFLLTLLIQGFYNIKVMTKQWKVHKFFLDIHQIVQFRKNILEIQRYYEITNTTLSTPLSLLKTELNNKFKEKIQILYQKRISQPDQRQIFLSIGNLQNLQNGQINPLTFMSMIQRLQWMFNYQNLLNQQNLRNNYQSIHMWLRKVNDRQFAIALEKEDNITNLTFLLNGIYLITMFLLGIIIIPVFYSFKKQEKQLNQLIEYLSFQEIRTSARILKLILSQFIRIDKLQHSRFLKSQIQAKLVQIKQDNQNQKSYLQRNSRSIIQNPNSKHFICKLVVVIILVTIFLANLSIVLISIFNSTSVQFQQNIRLAQELYQLENKPSYLLNMYLLNVNNALMNIPSLKYDDQMYKISKSQYFNTIRLVSNSGYQKNKITGIIKQDLVNQICNLIECPSNNSNISLDYLIYVFDNKFSYLSPTIAYNLTQSTVFLQKWEFQNRISSVIKQISSVIQISSLINDAINQDYLASIKNMNIILIVLGAILIPLNAFILIILQQKSLQYLNNVLKEAQNIYRHFSVQVLSQNTYLTSYFESKSKVIK